MISGESVMTRSDPVRCGKWRRVVDSDPPLRNHDAMYSESASRNDLS
jgi:hypothetical protein